jgi:hypothetical protein
MPLELYRPASPVDGQAGWSAPRRRLGLAWSQTRGVVLFVLTTVDDTLAGIVWHRLRRGDARGALLYLWQFLTDFWSCSVVVIAAVWLVVWGVSQLL